MEYQQASGSDKSRPFGLSGEILIELRQELQVELPELIAKLETKGYSREDVISEVFGLQESPTNLIINEHTKQITFRGNWPFN